MKNTSSDIDMAAAVIPDRPVANFLQRDDAAAYVRNTFGMPCSAQWLAKLAVVGGGPEYRKAGRTPIYARGALDSWANARLSKPVRSTAEYKLAEA